MRMPASHERATGRPLSYWLWMLVVALASIYLTVAIGNRFLPAGRAISGDAFGQGRDQGMLFDPALQLPDAKADEHGHHGQREDGETDRLHFGARSISRPGAAL